MQFKKGDSMNQQRRQVLWTVIGGISLLLASASATVAATFSPTTLTFSSQQIWTTSAAQQITLTNSGTGAYTIVYIVASGDYAETNNCGSSLAANASCQINVTFTPSMSGTRGGFITVSGSGSPALIAATLTGTGSIPALEPGDYAPTSFYHVKPDRAIRGVVQRRCHRQRHLER